MITQIKNKLRVPRTGLLRLRARFCPPLPLAGGPFLVIAPHPDDEILGCGGLIQRLCRQGALLHVVILTGGEKSHAFCCHTGEELIKVNRRRLAAGILSDLGLPAQNLHLLDFPDGSISPENSEMERLERIIQQVAPETIFIPHEGEGWPDHLVVNELIRAIPSVSQARLYEYCVWLWYYNRWNLDWKKAFLLTMTLKEYQTKKKAAHHYTDEQAPCQRPWAGHLPPVLVNACLWRKELFFNINK